MKRTMAACLLVGLSALFVLPYLYPSMIQFDGVEASQVPDELEKGKAAQIQQCAFTTCLPFIVLAKFTFSVTAQWSPSADHYSLRMTEIPRHFQTGRGPPPTSRTLSPLV